MARERGKYDADNWIWGPKRALSTSKSKSSNILYYENLDIKSLIGVTILSTFGEMALSRLHHPPKSFLGISDYIPTFFTVIGSERFSNIIYDILEDKGLKEIKITTTSLWITEKLFLKQKFPKFKCKLLKSSREKPLYSYFELISSFGPTLGTMFRFNDMSNRFIELYEKRLKQLNYYINFNILSIKELDFGVCNYVIFKYHNKNSKLIIVISDTSKKDKIGLLIEEPFIIDIFESAFDKLWDNGNPYCPITAQINKNRLNLDQRPWWWQ